MSTVRDWVLAILGFIGGASLLFARIIGVVMLFVYAPTAVVVKTITPIDMSYGEILVIALAGWVVTYSAQQIAKAVTGEQT